MTVPHIRATLPEGWQLDQVYADQVYDRIAAHLAVGAGIMETARQVGVADKTVGRFVRNGRPHNTIVQCVNCGNDMRPIGAKWAHIGGRNVAGCRAPVPPL